MTPNRACTHTLPDKTMAWVRGPYYIMAAASAEEPEYYPPAGIVNVEHCTLCGALRLPESPEGDSQAREITSKNLGVGAFPESQS